MSSISHKVLGNIYYVIMIYLFNPCFSKLILDSRSDCLLDILLNIILNVEGTEMIVYTHQTEVELDQAMDLSRVHTISLYD